jgi:N-acetyl sugar amidotransferase
MNFCSKCVYPHSAVNLDVDDDNICSSCHTFEEIKKITKEEWKLREKKLVEIIDNNKKTNKNEYDCLIPVGGGKDSYYQVHKILELGFNPLLVTYYGNNYLPEGQKNLDNMRVNFNCDHFIFYPSVKSLKKINLAAFKMMGDMNWHAHAGINIIPVNMALKYNVNIFVWGEIAWDVSGMFSHYDYVEFNKRNIIEHDMRGFTKDDFIGKENINEQDMSWCKLPTDEEFQKNNLRGLYLGNFIPWDAHKQTELIKKKYEWIESKENFERTYKKASNLDDMHENGIHDYLKWIKFGYGRCSDHASKDIRMGYFNRSKGIEYVKKYDHVKPKRDLHRWLEYVNISEDEFDNIADKFRDERVWSIIDNKWHKLDIDGEYRNYGYCNLGTKEKKRYEKNKH